MRTTQAYIYIYTSSCEKVPSSSLTISRDIELSVLSNLPHQISLFRSPPEKNIQKFESFIILNTNIERNIIDDKDKMTAQSNRIVDTKNGLDHTNDKHSFINLYQRNLPIVSKYGSVTGIPRDNIYSSAAK